ncbi:23S rRNA (adenine-N6)-dimethyltransferase [Brevibacterium casei CIP 102111]|uniref:23S rRNA (Adenine-N6)-dimethyltransferase n=1 Tax=Brevibacterium casei CIP 102111 TaxID=1255625 RepID=A0A2H1JFU0_9MICO|nr:23S ribosomal RNA methyltransferase Erm [Brevibacterium casei]QPR39094.1 23S ribosomal RNA methyltransferase Erm [Brevibacterium casei]QPR43260.1 23S ribosomal RNA methyltransferase Erm [Brevibacterium casei]SMX86356.1 23S rRNA (adenine-N6)-dimethyltransferase [Brevibacterium casei CIP 102111]
MRSHSQRPHSRAGGREELGQNFLRDHSHIATIVSLTRGTEGSILEIGPGAGAVTAELYRLGRPLTLVEIDETRISELSHRFPRARVEHADALRTRFDAEVVVGNLPFHLTTPILRRLLRARTWRTAVLLTQWEVARKRAGVGGATMMTAQWSPWFDFRLIERVPAHAFSPKPSVDGGILTVDRLPTGLVPHRDRSSYQQFVHAAFTGRGRGMKGILTHMKLADRRRLQSTMDRHHIRGDALPRELTPEQWAGLYTALSASSPATPAGRPTGRRTQRTTTTPEKARGKEETMRNDKGAKKNAQTKDKPVITGELPIVGVEKPAARLEAPIPGVDTSAKSHDKAHLQAERGYMPQHGKKSQPQPRWNLPRRQG